ncbi:MAG: hypothetical protein HKN91_06590 [Acidimicrobiia bacterium]|nr:hypothetical protein [Acidimicrobiia bacterium]
MTAPFQSEIVILDGSAEYEVHVAAADAAMPVGAFLNEAAGTQFEAVMCDGVSYPATTQLRELPLVRGSRLEGSTHVQPPPVAELLGTGSGNAGARTVLGPGVHRIGDRGSVGVGVQGGGDQGGTVSLYVDVDGAARVDPGSVSIAINGSPQRSMAPLRFGDELAVGRSRYRFGPPRSRVGSHVRVPFNRPPRAEYPSDLPRLIAPAKPPAAHKPMRFGWGALLIPLVIGGVMAFVWSPMMAIFAIFSPAMLLANYYEDKRRAKLSNAENDAAVADQMIEFRERLDATFRAARAMAWRTSPGPGELVERVLGDDSRLWQRRHDHPDFLEFGIGVGTVPWLPDVTPPQGDRAEPADEALREYTSLDEVPITVDLSRGGVIGIAGHRRRQIEAARWLVMQAAAHHGPADLAIVVITDDEAEWDCLKWLPQLQINGDSGRLAVASPGETADDLLGPLLESGETDPVAAMRDESGGPAILILADVSDVTTAAASSLRRVLAGEGSARRCGIALSGTVEELPSSCTHIMRIDPAGTATLDQPSRARRVNQIRAWRLSAGATRRAGRHIGRFHDPDLQIAGAGLADVVHLLDLIGLGDRTSDAVVRRWAAAGPVPRCAAPIGATADGPLVIDWVSDGPHGLLAGTTGAGKSELLRSLVAALAATVDPEHLNFVLIDYKGGSAFDACAGLPHTVGMVTDLDGHLAHRALTCLEAELRHREEVLRAVGAGDIDDYHAMDAEDPLPRLLVVIDEFAALAKELPDFMAALVDVAQRGRSLGVHLLLATQRPNGVINDNIRANTNLRLSLRVQDVQDSMDVVGTADAAGLPRSRPGRGYVRRGPGDVVAFQSALVTGQSGGGGSAVTVRPFVLVNDGTEERRQSEETEGARNDLSVLVEMVREAADKADMRPARLPWPDPLPEQLGRASVAQLAPVPVGRATIGLADEPHRQRQSWFSWNFESNLLVYGVQGSGTSTALSSAIAAACEEAGPEDLHAYVLDYDDQRLKPLEALPHVGAVIGAGERDRQLRLIRYLGWEVAERRELAASDPEGLAARPRIIVGIDNFGGFRSAFEEPGDMATKDAVTRLVADGPGVGIVVVATAKQPIEIPTNISSLVTAKLVMRLADRYEYAGLGVTTDEPTEIAGRSFESGTSLEVQLFDYSPEDLESLAASIPAPPAPRAPWPIQLLPAEVKIPDVVDGAEVFELEWRVPVAIGDDRLGPAGWNLREGDHVLISGPARSGKSTTLRSIATVLKTARPELQITAIAPRRSALSECPEIDLLLTEPAQLTAVLASVEGDRPHAILIDDAEDLADEEGILAALVGDRHPHRRIFAAGAADVLRSSYGHWTQGVRRSRLGLALKPNLLNDGDLWQTSLPRHGPTFYPPGRGFLIAEGRAELAQVAWQ